MNFTRSLTSQTADSLNTSTATPSTQNLLDNAVHNTSIFSLKGLQNRLFARWFNRLVYPQIWEDPEVDIAALNLNAHSRIFTISSGGCNALNYLSVQPEHITVVDLNEAHIALIRLKLAALKHLPDFEAFFDFFGRANLPKNIDHYHAYLKPNLDSQTLAYWEGKERVWGKKRIEFFTDGFYNHGLLGQFIGLIHWTSRQLGYDISKVMQARTLAEQTRLFDEHVAPVFETRLIKFLSNRPVVLYSLGIPPAQFNEMVEQSNQQNQGMHLLLQTRARRLACQFDLKTNYFAWQAFNRQYDIEHLQAVPRYLQAPHFKAVSQGQSNVEVFHQSMTERLKAMPAQSLNAYLFLDAQDWMDAQQLTELWQEVNRTAQPNARVVFRTAGITSPLEENLPSALLSHWRTDTNINHEFTEQDRSGIYGGVHVYVHAQ
ncbi:DUF3419 family protein [Thiomicrorhabdus aquaedulcis]|uniref:DUF3419 family protein n=1 Tax=Thiomicrorhabdus aquaedulcis TaxID=2211106 RepID=UPI000FD8A176|nr:BtaA family protein [Thiomicrorhabdus aquaedulcis]